MVYRQPPGPPGITPHKPSVYRTTRLGQVVKVDGSVIVDEALDNNNLLKTYSLVMADSDPNATDDLQNDMPWVLVIACNITQPFPEFGDEQQWVVPLLADITIGAGGASHTFTIDAWPYASIQLPAGSVKVTLRWDIMGPNDSRVKAYPEPNDPGSPHIVPGELEVIGTLVKGYSNNNARRSFLIQSLGDATLSTGAVEIPDFAHEVFYWWDNNSADFAALAGELQLMENDQVGFNLASYTFAQLLALKAVGQLAHLPANAGFWRLQITAPDPTPLPPTRVSFPIRL